MLVKKVTIKKLNLNEPLIIKNPEVIHLDYVHYKENGAYIMLNLRAGLEIRIVEEEETEEEKTVLTTIEAESKKVEELKRGRRSKVE